jgi:hypothetical protein
MNDHNPPIHYFCIVSNSDRVPFSTFPFPILHSSQLPKELHRADGYDHKEALFGDPPYGGSIQQNVYYADSTMCDSSTDYAVGGYPKRTVVDKKSGAMEPWKTPFILVVDRGDCTFVKKVRNAQRSGATAVIIADTTCLCVFGPLCGLEEGQDCEANEPIMADDGSGADITVPSFLMYKQDVDPVIEVLKNNQMVRMEMSWELPQDDAIVELELWTSPKDLISRPMQRKFSDVSAALGNHATFTPHMYLYDGVQAGCQDEDGQNQCYNLCTNNGRYCTTDPDDDLDEGLSGADVIAESLRRLCVWKEYGSDGIGMEYWNYVNEFLFRCDDQPEFFISDTCIKDAMDHAGVEKHKIDACMQDSGGLEDDNLNQVLEQELAAREASGVVIVPSFYVNSAPLRGAMNIPEVFEAICAGYRSGSEPDVCKHCAKCGNVEQCIKKGHCYGQAGTISVPFFIGTVIGLTVVFGCVGLYYYQRQQREMREQIKGIMAEYMPVDPNKEVETVGLSADEGEFS